MPSAAGSDCQHERTRRASSTRRGSVSSSWSPSSPSLLSLSLLSCSTRTLRKNNPSPQGENDFQHQQQAGDSWDARRSLCRPSGGAEARSFGISPHLRVLPWPKRSTQDDGVQQRKPSHYRHLLQALDPSSGSFSLTRHQLNDFLPF